jgi:hypothetical protein
MSTRIPESDSRDRDAEARAAAQGEWSASARSALEHGLARPIGIR